ncbi:unnamed protein product [Sphagnum tenellum]
MDTVDVHRQGLLDHLSRLVLCYVWSRDYDLLRMVGVVRNDSVGLCHFSFDLNNLYGGLGARVCVVAAFAADVSRHLMLSASWEFVALAKRAGKNIHLQVDCPCTLSIRDHIVMCCPVMSDYMLFTDLYQIDLVAGYYHSRGEDRKPDARASEFLCSHWFEGKD